MTFSKLTFPYVSMVILLVHSAEEVSFNEPQVDDSSTVSSTNMDDTFLAESISEGLNNLGKILARRPSELPNCNIFHRAKTVAIDESTDEHIQIEKTFDVDGNYFTSNCIFGCLLQAD